MAEKDLRDDRSPSDDEKVLEKTGDQIETSYGVLHDPDVELSEEERIREVILPRRDQILQRNLY